MGFLDWLRRVLQIGPADNRPVDWPPPNVKADWDLIASFRRRYENDRNAMLKADPAFRGASDEKKKLYTPVPLAHEMARLSAALLFSAEPKITNGRSQQEEVLKKVLDANGLGGFLFEAAEYVAIEGRGALRVIRDEEVSDQPLITWVAGDRVIWREKHGRFVTGGYVVVERRPNRHEDKVYRLIEEHKPGRIERTVYQGRVGALGKQMPALSWPEEFKGLPEATDVRIDKPTLYRWDNVPGGRSDLWGLETYLDRLNEGESLMLDKVRKSVPVTLADRKLSDKQGYVDLYGVILTGGSAQLAGEGLAKTVETIQPDLQAEEHLSYLRHVRESILMYAGYSLASWGLDKGGSADSGKALRLRQARTLLTRAGKERSAREAIENAVAAACAWSDGARSVEPYRPEIAFGDGLPTDPLEDAQEAATKRGGEVISIDQAVRELHPEWDEKAITEEVGRIKGEQASLQPPGAVPTPNLNLGGP